MDIKLPDFRNLMTTGNVLSACVTCFLAGTVWSDLNNRLSVHDVRLEKIEKIESEASKEIQVLKDKDIQDLKKASVKVETQLSYVSAQIADLKRWVEKVSDQIGSTRR